MVLFSGTYQLNELVNISFIPTLVDISLAKIGSTMISSSMLKYISHVLDFHKLESLSGKEWEDLIDSTVSKLPLPRNFQKELLGIMRHQCLSVLKLKDELQNFHLQMARPVLRAFNLPESHECRCLRSICLTDNFQWKSDGSLDVKNTHRKLILNNNLDIVFRFGLACNSCLEENVLLLWKKMYKHLKKALTDYFYTNFREHSLDLVEYWCHRLTVLSSTDQLNFGYGSQTNYIDNIDAIRYRLEKMHPSKRLYYLACLFRYESKFKDPSLGRFCWMQLDVLTREKVLMVRPGSLVCCFVNWPWIKQIYKVLEGIPYDIADPEDFDFLYSIIHKKAKFGYEDFDYMGLLKVLRKNRLAHCERYLEYHQLDISTNLVVMNYFTDLSSVLLPFAKDIFSKSLKRVTSGSRKITNYYLTNSWIGVRTRISRQKLLRFCLEKFLEVILRSQHF